MCPETYSGGSGYQCHPLIIKLTYDWEVPYTCSGWGVLHDESVQVGDANCEKCSVTHSEEVVNGTVKTATYWIGLNVPSGTGCDKKSSGCKVKFRTTPPDREWNNHDGTDPPQEKPYDHWDSGNPTMTIKVEAKHKDSSDSDKMVFEQTNNPHPDGSEFAIPTEQTLDVVVEVDTSGEVKVRFDRVY